MSTDEIYMKRCIALAELGLGNVAPNPMVGAVLVHKDMIIGEGYHQEYGKAHAEVNCIHSVKEKNQHLISQSTLYVNLEPCVHFGKTPPCTDLILDYKIPKVTIGSLDPNPLVAGKGMEKLQANGVLVSKGILQADCDFLNRRFFTFHAKKRPYLILKWAQTKDGFIAPAEKKKYWLTSAASTKLVHQWRSEEPAIMVGTNTVLDDNPQLTVRHVQGRNPLRIMIDREMRIPSLAKILDESADTIIYNSSKTISQGHLHFVQLNFNKSVLPQIMKDLFERKIQSVIVEGGAMLLNTFIKENLWDEARIFTTSFDLEQGLKAPIINGYTISELKIETDYLKIIVR